MSRRVRVANCSGFYGDRATAAAEVLRGGPIDVLTGDWLAELTMSILAMDRASDPTAGFARTFPRQLEPLLPEIAERGIRVVSNAGGLAPDALADRIRAQIRDAGLPLRVAVVRGDDLSGRLQAWLRDGQVLSHLDTGFPFDPGRTRPLTANAYLGCWGIAAALEAGADIVITGRVTDAAVVMGAAAWWHDWSPADWDPLAGALAAGHVIECGTQATGGNQPFWTDLDLRDVGFPIAEIDADGTAVITKHPGTGGRVDRHSVTAQLLYEIGSPDYISPDVVARFDTLVLEEESPDRVRIAGARGAPPPPTLKLGITALAGHRNRMTAMIGGRDGGAKARLLQEIAWERLGGRETFDDARSDVYARTPGEPASPVDDITLVDFQVRDADPKKVGTRFTAPLVELALATIPGLTFTTGPQRPRPVGIFWPVLVDRAEVPVTVDLGDRSIDVPHPPSATTTTRDLPALPPPVLLSDRTEPLGVRVGARSGDKGGNANVGLWVREPDDYAWLCTVVTEERLRDWLPGFDGRIDRYALPRLHAVNLVLHGYLGDGVAGNLAPDAQAKLLGELLRAHEVPLPV